MSFASVPSGGPISDRWSPVVLCRARDKSQGDQLTFGYPVESFPILTNMEVTMFGGATGDTFRIDLQSGGIRYPIFGNAWGTNIALNWHWDGMIPLYQGDLLYVGELTGTPPTINIIASGYSLAGAPHF